MNFKCLFLICVLVQVSDISACDDIIKCIGGAVTGLFNNKHVNVSKDTKLIANDTNTTKIQTFDLTHLQKNLGDILTEVTDSIKKTIEGKLEISSETESDKSGNNTIVQVKILEFVDSDESNEDDEIKNVTSIKVDKDLHDLDIKPEDLSSEDPDGYTDIIFNPQIDDDNITSLINDVPIKFNIPNVNYTSNETNVYDTRRTFGTNWKNVSEIYIEPLHIDIAPETKPNGGIENFIENLKKSFIKNITLTKPINDNSDKVIIDLTPNLIQNTTENIDKDNRTNIENDIKLFQNLFKDYILKDVSLLNDAITTTTTAPSVVKTVDKKKQQVNSHENVAVRIEDEKDNEIPNSYDSDIYGDYNFDDIENDTDYLNINYIELYKDTTNEDVDYVTASYDLRSGANSKEDDTKSTIDASEVSPFISTIYIRANSTNHFDYVCDGAVISKNVIITAARCVSTANGTISAGDVLVILGKRSLVESGDGEKMFRVKQVQLHQNFSRSTNDLALLLLEDITFSDVIKTINVTYEEYSPASEAITTGWALSGDLTVIPFDYDKSAECNKNKQDATLFCATYGHGISFCPSYGGLYMTKTGTSWILQGIRNGDTSERTICMNNNVMYTPLNTYEGWIRDFVNRY